MFAENYLAERRTTMAKCPGCPCPDCPGSAKTVMNVQKMRKSKPKTMTPALSAELKEAKKAIRKRPGGGRGKNTLKDLKAKTSQTLSATELLKM